MRKQFEDELINAIMPYIESIEDVKMKIALVCREYDIQKTETALAVYEGDVNEQMLKRFLIAKAARGCSARTVRYYGKSIPMSLEKIGKAYNEITPDDIRAYLALRVQREGVSKTTANNERRNLSAFYAWLQKEEILLKNPMNKVEAIKETKKKRKAFTQMELEQIRNACRTTREKAMIEVLASTWCRVSEVVSMKIYDIDGNQITVLGKGDKERTVYLNPKAQLAVGVYLQDREDNNPYLFPRAKYAGNVAMMTKTRRDAEWYKEKEMVGSGAMDKSSLESIVRNIGRRANVQNAHPHRFRRTGATMALRAGMPLLTVSKMLGHENIGTTQIYLDISDRELEQAHERFVC